MQRFKNWMSYTFNDINYGSKQSIDDKLEINFNKKISKKLPSYYDALLNNAMIMRDSFSEPFDVCLSGGTDSEVVVRIFKKAKIKHNTVIFKLEKNLNTRDVDNAIELCNSLNLKYKIIDFNLKKFFENEAEQLFKKTFIPYVGRLPRLKFIDYLDNIPIFCDGEPYWRRELEKDYSKKSQWHFHLTEDGYAVSIYSRLINRIVIGDWYEFTPEVIMSYNELPFVKKLLNDEFIGKVSNISSKVDIHKEYWPKMKKKIKLVGYEGEDGAQGSRPEFMIEFYHKFMSEIENTTFKYTEQELKELILK